ncbi:MAG: gamma-glutamyl-gamma-aminobutyrate hydrolase family protein [candidate division WOR-3 bacterium]|nr:gamma-glutamyl-gamma-aminobutyrate hydrolase family protein [candidate division WOR-3 bacterium]
MKPLIGLTTGITASRYYTISHYITAIMESGGIPLLLPSVDVNGEGNIILASHMLSRIDGVLFTGGGDIDPLFYGEHRMASLSRVYRKRDGFELALAKVAVKEGLPVLGICRGCQVLNVMGGGTLKQHVESHWQELPEERAAHRIKIEKDTKLFNIMKEKEVMVNSFHRQAIKELAFGFIISAYADDGVVEGIESRKHKFVIGVQFHPENLFQESSAIKRLFSSFINACKGIL